MVKGKKSTKSEEYDACAININNLCNSAIVVANYGPRYFSVGRKLFSLQIRTLTSSFNLSNIDIILACLCNALSSYIASNQKKNIPRKFHKTVIITFPAGGIFLSSMDLAHYVLTSTLIGFLVSSFHSVQLTLLRNDHSNMLLVDCQQTHLAFTKLSHPNVEAMYAIV